MRLRRRSFIDFVRGSCSSRAPWLLVIFLVYTFFIYDCAADTPVPLNTGDLQAVLNTTAVSFDNATGDYVFDGDYNEVHMTLQCDNGLLNMAVTFKTFADQGLAVKYADQRTLRIRCRERGMSCEAQVVKRHKDVVKRFDNVGSLVNVNITRRQICVSGTCATLYDDPDDPKRWTLIFSRLSTWTNEGEQTEIISPVLFYMPTTRIPSSVAKIMMTVESTTASTDRSSLPTGSTAKLTLSPSSNAGSSSTLLQSTPPTSTSDRSSPENKEPTTKQPRPNDIPAGAIAGMVIMSLIILALLILLVFVCLKPKSRSSSTQEVE